MRRPTLLLLAVALFTAISLPALQSQPQEPPKEKKKPRKVWTEDDLGKLGGNINVVGTEAPPPAPPGQPPAPAAPRPEDALWRELDDLLAERKMIQTQIDLNRDAVDSLNNKLNEENDPLNIEELLEGRTWQENELATWEEELVRVNARIAELEKLTAGRKRPPSAQPKAKTPVKQRPAAEGEEALAEEPPAEEGESPAEEEPPPPPPLS